MKYDFIEIGTSDFDTLLETTTNKIGISIEPLKYYLDSLPNNDKVIKVNCAISDSNFETDIFWVSPSDIEKYNLPNWLRGCNSIISSHPSVVKILENTNLLEIYKTSKCKCITWSTLISIYDITSVDLLKIDTEGHDCKIIQNILISNAILPNEILFEHNVLTSESEFKDTMDLLNKKGYYEVERGVDTIKVKKMKVLILGDGLLGNEIKKQTQWDSISRKTHTFDFCDITSVYKYLKDYDVILNCIANTDTYSDNKEDHWGVNYKAVSRLTDWCSENNKKLVHISTDFVYANSTGSASEDNVPVHANNWYSYTKLLADGYIELKGKDYLIIRTSFKPKPFPYDTAFIDLIGNCDYVDVIASGIINLINKKATGLYNVGTEMKSIYDLAKETKPDVKSGLSRGWMPQDTRMNCNKFKNANKEN